MKRFNLKRLWCAVTISATCFSAATAEDQLLVIGDATWGGWSLDKSSVMVQSKENPDVFTYTGFLTADKEFKFLTEAQWGKNEYRNGAQDAASNPYILGAGKLQKNGDDNKFKVAASANYTIVCNLADMTISVDMAQYQEAPVLHNVLYLVGDATPGGWSLGESIPLTQSDSNPFSFSGYATLKKSGTFKIATNCHADYGQKFFFRDSNDSGKLTEDATDDRQWRVDADGYYLVTADIKDNTISITPATPQAETEKRLCWYEPATAQQNDEITLYFNAAAGNRGLEGFNGEIFITSGIITADNDDMSGLAHMIGPDGTTPRGQYTMTRSSDNPDIYYIKLVPETYYVAAGNKIKMLGMRFASADGSKIATDADGGLIYVPFKTNTGVMWYHPEKATLADKITLRFDATMGNAALRGFDKGVYVHAGVITDESTGDSDWKHSSGWLDNDARYSMTRSTVDPDQYMITLTPNEFFNLDGSENVLKMAFVPRSSNGSRTARNENGSDITVEFINGRISSEKTPLGSVTSWSREPSGLLITAENGTMSLTPYKGSSIKVLTRINGDDTPERQSITVSGDLSSDFTIEEKDGYVSIVNGSTTASVDMTNCHISFYNGTELVLREKEGLDNSSLPRSISFEGMGDRAFYGGGYNGQRIDHDGQTLVMNNTQTGGWESTWGAPHNICVPFIVSTSGYGILFDDHYRNAKISPSSEGTTYSSSSPTPVSYFFVGSDDGTMESVMENYTLLTGRQELPPYWALGYMTSRYGYHSRSEAENVISSLKKAALPVDAIVFDLYWQGEGNSGMGNLDWYAPNWNNPREMMTNFNNMGVKTICITEPFFTSASSNYSILKERGFFADDDVSGMEWLGASPVGLIDASNPAAMDWMWQFYKARTEEGVAGWWLDLGEPERHDADSRHMGGSVGQVHNEFGDLWTSRVYRGFKEDFPEVRPFLMPRAGTAGMQRYSTFPWTGDIKRSWEGLQAQIPALVSAGMSGIGYMGSDVGGFAASSTDANLYLRWIQMAMFSPMMRTHSTFNPEPYLDCYSEVLPYVRDFLNLRYSFLPYTYSAAWENATKGTPLARPINFHDTEDSAPSPADCKDQYLWGRDIMVAPVVTNTYSRSITFPQGTWVDLNDMQTSYAGGTTINYNAPLDKLPYFGRKGSFITRFSQKEYTNTGAIDNSKLTVIYLPDENAGEVVSTVFEDNRVSTNTLEKNEYQTLSFCGRNSASESVIEISHKGSYAGMPSAREFTFVIPGYGKSAQKVVSGTLEFMKAATREEFDKSDVPVYYTDDSNCLLLKTTIKSADKASISITHDASGIAEAIVSDGSHLSYCHETGSVEYSANAIRDAEFTLSSPTGACFIKKCGLPADGSSHRFPLGNLQAGIYIGSLTWISASGHKTSRSIKILVH